jgi:hypothetical protein
MVNSFWWSNLGGKQKLSLDELKTEQIKNSKDK